MGRRLPREALWGLSTLRACADLSSIPFFHLATHRAERRNQTLASFGACRASRSVSRFGFAVGAVESRPTKRPLRTNPTWKLVGPNSESSSGLPAAGETSMAGAGQFFGRGAEACCWRALTAEPRDLQIARAQVQGALAALATPRSDRE